MYKKTLLSLAVASSVALTGCIGDVESGDDTAAKDPNPQGLTWPLFNPGDGELPIPSDLNFDSEQGDGTFGIAVPTGDTTIVPALNELSGNSTVAPAVIQTNGQLDPATVKGLVDETGVTGAAQTVFLIELDYPSGDPVQGLSAQEVPTVSASQNLYRADVESIDGQSAIRIVPIEPLDPGKRYVVVVTNEVKDINGDAITQSPTYEYLTREAPVTAPLRTVQTLINSLWEATTEGYFAAAVNPLRAAAEADLEPLTKANIALSYSFTTSNDEQVLKYIAEPAAWFVDQITTFVRLTASTTVGGEYSARKSAADTAIAEFPVSLGLDPENPSALSALFAGPPTQENPSAGLCEGTSGEAAIECVGLALASQNIANLPTPISRTTPEVEGVPQFRDAGDIDFTGATPQPIGAISAVAGNVISIANANLSEGDPEIPATAVYAVEGTVDLPNYKGFTEAEVTEDPTRGSELVRALSGRWVADDDLASSLNDTFSDLGVTIPQADPTVSSAVNYVFPFPKQQSTVEVPLLVIYPSDGDAKGIVIFQHGIRQDRASALTIGTNLALNDYVVVAIDQPLHGVNPSSTAERLDLANQLLTAAPELNADTVDALGLATALVEGASAFDTALAAAPQPVQDAFDAPTRASLVNTVANAGSSIPGLAPFDGTPRHFNVFADGTDLAQMMFDPENAAGTSGSGSFFINLQNFLNTRDNNRQSVVDQMNLRASLTAGGVTIPGPVDIPINSDTPVFFAGHSLGTITGAPYVAAVNQNRVTFGGNPITALLPEQLGGPVLSTSNDILAANLLTPGGGVVRLLENSPSFAPEIVGGLLQVAKLPQNTSNYELFLNVNQAAVDSADPINFANELAGSTRPTLLSIVIGDTVIPNAADELVWGEGNGALSTMAGNLVIESFPAPLAGSFPLDAGASPFKPAEASGNISRTDYDSATYPGVNHGSPVDPVTSPTAFTTMSAEAAAFFDANLPAQQ